MIIALKYDKIAIYKSHLDYLRSGAQIIRTNTYRAVEQTIMQHLGRCERTSLSFIVDAAKLAKDAVDDYWNIYRNIDISKAGCERCKQCRPLVAGSCGSCSAAYFDSPEETVKNAKTLKPNFLTWFHERRIGALIEAGVDLLAFESLPSVVEAEAMIKVLKRYPNARAWITFLCPQGTKLADGSDFAEAVIRCYDSLPNQIVALGADSAFPKTMKPLLRQINDSRTLKIPFLFYPDKSQLSFERNTCESNIMSQETYLLKLYHAGVRYIGGGINTHPEDIKNISKCTKHYFSINGNLSNLYEK